MRVGIETPWRERASAMIAEAGFAVPDDLPDGDSEVRVYWTVAEGAVHFEEPEILRDVAPSYYGSAEAARSAAVLMLHERIERLRRAVERDREDE